MLQASVAGYKAKAPLAGDDLVNISRLLGLSNRLRNQAASLRLVLDTALVAVWPMDGLYRATTASHVSVIDRMLRDRHDDDDGHRDGRRRDHDQHDNDDRISFGRSEFRRPPRAIAGAACCQGRRIIVLRAIRASNGVMPLWFACQNVVPDSR